MENEELDVELGGNEKEKLKITDVFERSETKVILNWPVFIILSLLYLAVLVGGILSAFFELNVLYDNPLMNKFSGLWFIALFVSFGMFFFSLAPIKKMSKKVRIIGYTLFTLAYCGMQMLPISFLINNQASLVATKNVGVHKFLNAFQLSIASLSVSFFVIFTIYLTTWLKFAFKDKKEIPYLKIEDGCGIAKCIFTVLANIFIAMGRGGVLLLRLKEKHINIFMIIVLPISVLLTPLFAEIITIGVLALLVMFIISLLEGMIINPNSISGSNDAKQIEITNSMGCSTILTEDSPGHYHDSGWNWYSDNGDGTVSPD